MVSLIGSVILGGRSLISMDGFERFSRMHVRFILNDLLVLLFVADFSVFFWKKHKY